MPSWSNDEGRCLGCPGGCFGCTPKVVSFLGKVERNEKNSIVVSLDDGSGILQRKMIGDLLAKNEGRFVLITYSFVDDPRPDVPAKGRGRNFY